MADNNLLLDLEFPEEGPGKKMIQKTEKYTVLRLCIKKGNIIPPHPDDHTALFTVLKGKGIFARGDDRIELSAGSYIFIPKGKARGIESVEDLVVLALN